MKKRIYWVLFLLIPLGLCTNLLCRNEIKYPVGIDTIASFGDGTYQISSGTNRSLFNEKYGSCMIQQVDQFYTANEKVYLVGRTVNRYLVDEQEITQDYEIYSVIQLDNNRMTLCVLPQHSLDSEIYIYRLDEMIDHNEVHLISDLSSFSEEDNAVFISLNSNESAPSNTKKHAAQAVP